MRSSHWISLALSLLIAGLFGGLEHQRIHDYVDSVAASPSPAAFYMQHAEWATWAARFKLRGPRKPDPNIVIIAVDEKSLETLHQWPWPRSIHAQLIRTLEANPPKALVFDILFIEPFTADPAGDKALVKATAQNPWVVHSMFFELDGAKIQGAKIPFPALIQAASHVGYVNAFPDDDGVLRSAVLDMDIQGQTVPLISVAGTGLYAQRPVEDLVKTIPGSAPGHMLLNFVGPAYSYPYISYADVLKGDVPASQFAGKIVLVGSSATGTYDHYPTATSPSMPGIEFHANVADNVIHHNSLRLVQSRWAYLTIALMGLLCGLVLARFSAWAGALGVLGIALGYSAFAQYLFVRRAVAIDMAAPLLTLGLGYVVIVIYRFFTEEREKRWVKAAFGQYVSPKVLEILMADPSKLRLVGERREMSMFFSDVAGFTSISERLNPDELVVLLNRYLTAMTEVVFETDGYLNKYMGDGIMAFWNAPVKQPDHAERACRCAIQSMQRLAALNSELEKQGLVPLKARIGVNTGNVAVGNMGSTQKSDYTVMGDHVNLASRLEGANKSFGSSIMISEFTYEVVQHQFEVRFLDIIRVPGKAKPVKTYELLGEKGSLSEAWQKAIPLYHEAIQCFADRQFETARTKFLEVLKIIPHDKSSETYIQRAEVFMVTPPPKDWDGVFELKTK